MVAADCGERGDRRDADQCGDETILDGGGATLIAQQPNKKFR
jgi:hypothetical protein